MKSIIKEPIIKSAQYPKILKAKDYSLVVLFLRDKEGTVISTNDTTWSLGYFSDGWTMDEFTNFNGSVTLEND